MIYSKAKMLEKWEEYKDWCDSQTVVRTEFCQKTASFVTAEIPAPITYTIMGFANYLGMTQENLYLTYFLNKKRKPVFSPVHAMIKDECEQDARKKFENGTLKSQLSGLWMSKYGYTTDTKAEIKTPEPVIFIGADKLED